MFLIITWPIPESSPKEVIESFHHIGPPPTSSRSILIITKILKDINYTVKLYLSLYCYSFIYLRYNLLLNSSISTRIGELNNAYGIVDLFGGLHSSRTPFYFLCTLHSTQRFASFFHQPISRFRCLPK